MGLGTGSKSISPEAAPTKNRRSQESGAQKSNKFGDWATEEKGGIGLIVIFQSTERGRVACRPPLIQRRMVFFHLCEGSPTDSAQ